MTANLEELEFMAQVQERRKCPMNVQALRAAIAEISALRDAQVGADVGAEWRPIETAPKEGFFLVWSPQFPDMAMPFRADLFASGRRANTPKHLSAGHYTHWMPMPQPPGGVGARVRAEAQQQNEPA